MALSILVMAALVSSLFAAYRNDFPLKIEKLCELIVVEFDRSLDDVVEARDLFLRCSDLLYGRNMTLIYARCDYYRAIEL